MVLAEDKEHPNYLRSRFPAHEVEALVEKAVREKLPDMVIEAEGSNLEYLIQQHEVIPTYDLVRSLVKKVTVYHDKLVLSLNLSELNKLVYQHLRMDMDCYVEDIEVKVPYQSERRQKGTIVIKPEGKTDVFNLPPTELKKLIQGIVWWEEHFDGVSLKSIARREHCSQDYVGSAISYSFKTLQSSY